MGKMSTTPEDTSPTLDDYTWSRDSTSGALKKTLWSKVLSMFYGSIYPVGSVYINASNNANPSTFGFPGTWVAFAQGRMVVGLYASDTDFDNLGDSGGEKTVSLNGDQNGSHAHGVYDPGHTHYSVDPGQGQTVIQNSSVLKTATSGSGAQITYGNSTTSNSGSNIGIYGSGSGAPHNNMPPYVVACMWKRTA